MSNAPRNGVTNAVGHVSGDGAVTGPEEGRRKKEDNSLPVAASLNFETTHPLTPSQEGGLAQVCSRCQAKAGEPCRDRGGKEREPHASRGRPKTLNATQRNQAFEAAGRTWAEQHLPDLPLIFVFAAWCVEKYVVQGDPDPAKVRNRVELRMERIAKEETA